jgi:tetratricopeptide (TPR) repeat protein
MGIFYTTIKDFNVAYGYFIQSAEKYKVAGDTLRLARTYRELGKMFAETQNLPLTKKYFLLAYNHMHRLNKPDDLVVVLDLLGIYFHRAGNLDSAEYFYRKAYKINEEISNPLAKVQNLINFGSVNVDFANYDRAKELLFRALQFSDSFRDTTYITSYTPYIYTNLGVLYNRTNKFDSAKFFLGKALPMIPANGDPILRINVFYELFYASMMLNNKELSKYAIGRYVALNDSLNKQNNKEELLALEMKYNFHAQQKDQMIRQQRFRLIVSGLGILSVFLIIVLILLYRQQKAKVHAAKIEKKIVDDQLATRNRELTSHMLNMVRINERKVSLIEVLRQQLPEMKKENQRIVSNVIESFENDHDEKAWREFEIRFTEVHKEFYDKLSRVNPNLTVNEKRLCAFLLLDMTSKEISAITGQSNRAIELARTRLRKQLGLTNQNVSLSGFLSSL